jgi:uncharacterized damage-inducible protein DinB
MKATEIRALFAYDEWANARVLNAAAGLAAEQLTRDLGSSFATLGDTLAHIVAVEWLWLRRWQGESPATTPEWASGTDARLLRAKLDEIEAERRQFLAPLRDEDMARQLTYKNFKGEEWSYALGDMFLHLVNHSTYHRGQVATMLRQLGAPGSATDLLLYKDEVGA